MGEEIRMEIGLQVVKMGRLEKNQCCAVYIVPIFLYI